MHILGLLLILIFLFLSGIHVYWALTGKLSSNSVIPTRDGKALFSPSVGATLLVAIALLLAALLVAGKINLIVFSRIPDFIFESGTWGIAIIFLLRAVGEFNYVGFFKKQKGTKFAEMDTRFFSPLCLFIAISAALINL